MIKPIFLLGVGEGGEFSSSNADASGSEKTGGDNPGASPQKGDRYEPLTEVEAAEFGRLLKNRFLALQVGEESSSGKKEWERILAFGVRAAVHPESRALTVAEYVQSMQRAEGTDKLSLSKDSFQTALQIACESAVHPLTLLQAEFFELFNQGKLPEGGLSLPPEKLLRLHQLAFRTGISRLHPNEVTEYVKLSLKLGGKEKISDEDLQRFLELGAIGAGTYSREEALDFAALHVRLVSPGEGEKKLSPEEIKRYRGYSSRWPRKS